MPTMSSHLANKVLDAIVNNQSVVYPNVYLSLHTDNPGDTGLNEVTAGENTYARKETAPADWASADDKEVVTSSAFEWNDMPGVTVTHIGVWDALSTGNFLWGGELSSSKAVPAGETFRFTEGNIKLEIDPSV